MQTKILFFASLREKLGTDQEIWESLDGITRVSEVIEKLKERGGQWQDVFNNEALLISVNQTFASADSELNEGDEIAFMPPVTGG